MSDGSTEAIRAMTLLTSALIEMASRLAAAATERWMQRMRAAAHASEQAARAERTRLATTHAADAALWRQTANPAWWQTATPQQLFDAWQAASTWQHHDQEAARARTFMASQLHDRGVQPASRPTTDPEAGQYIRDALDLASAERQQRTTHGLHVPAGDAPTLRQPQQRGESKQQQREVRPMPPGHTPVVSPTKSEASWPTSQTPADVPLAGARPPDIPSKKSSPVTGPATQPAKSSSLGTPWPSTPSRSKAQATAHRVPATAADLKNMETVLRQAIPPADASAILADPAWPVLAKAMHQLKHTGTDLHTLLQQVADIQPPQGRLPAVHTAAALRSAAESPAHLRNAQHSRTKHQQRLQRQQQLSNTKQVTATGAGTDPAIAKNASLLNIAFPTTTRQALSQSTAQAASARQQTPEQIRRTPRTTSHSAGTSLERS